MVGAGAVECGEDVSSGRRKGNLGGESREQRPGGEDKVYAGARVGGTDYKAGQCCGRTR